MKYIRTKDGIYERMFPNEEQQMSFDHKTIEPAYYTTKNDWVAKRDVIAQADTIEELCDECVVVFKEYYNSVERLRRRTLYEPAKECSNCVKKTLKISMVLFGLTKVLFM